MLSCRPKILLAVAATLMASPAADNAAPTASIGPVILGYVFDPPAGGLRPITGMPAAALIGPPVHLGPSLSWAEIASRHNYALGILAESKEVVVLDLEGGRPGWRPMEGVPPGPERMVLSPSGSAAALLYSDRRRLRVLTGLPGELSRSWEADLPPSPAEITAAAVSDDAGVALVGTIQDDAGAVLSVGPGGASRLVWAGGRVSALRFRQRSRDALVADYGSHRVFLLRDAGGRNELLQAAGERNGISHPIDAAFSSDGRRVITITADSNSIVITDLDSGASSELTSPEKPSGLHPLQGESVFRLTDLAARPILVLEAGDPEPRVLLVPWGPGAFGAAQPVPAPRWRGRP